MSDALYHYYLDLQEAMQEEKYWRKVKLGIIKREDERTEPTEDEREWIENLLERKMNI